MDSSARPSAGPASQDGQAASSVPVAAGEIGTAGAPTPPSPATTFGQADGPALGTTPATPALGTTPATPDSGSPGSGPNFAADGLARRVGRRFRRLKGRPPRPMTRRKARVILACLALLAAGITWATVSLAIRGLSVTGVSAAKSPTPLIMPAPERAAGLPRHYRLTTDQRVLLAIAQFRRRFARLQAGRSAAYPAALYAEPGRADLASGSSAWVMYLGYNARASVGDPAATMTRLMASLAGQATARSWPVPAGIQGGNARCMVAVLGLTSMSVCGWATNQTIAALMSPTRDTSVTELATLMQLMGGNLQPR